VSYCYNVAASGAVIPLRLFNTLCWGDPATVYLQDADVPTIDRVGIQFNSTSKAITLTNVCVESISFGN